MKKIILILCCCSLFPLQTHAQIWGLLKSAGKAGAKKGATTTVAKTGTTTFNRNLPNQTRRVATVLERRAADSYRRAAEAQARVESTKAKFPYSFRPKAVQSVSLGEHHGVSALKVAQQTHPQPYLQGSAARIERNMANYIQAQNNRLFTQFANSIADKQARLPEILHKVQAETQQIGMPENPTRWLAEQIPANTNILVLGEGFYHNPSVIDATSAFLTELRRKMPERKIILLTHSLESDVAWTPQLNPAVVEDYRVGREPFYKNAYENNMEVIGLKDARFSHYDIALQAISPKGYEQSYFWVNSYEALQQQGTLLLEKVASIRAQYPDALIIVHVNQDQSSYNLPFSLANRLETNNEKLFVTGITSKTYIQRKANPFPGEETQPLTTRTTLFEQMYEQAHLPDEGVVSKGLAKDVGADAWIKVPFNPAKTDTGIY